MPLASRGGPTVLIQGRISEATAAEFKAILASRPVSRVLLDSGGGLVEPSIEIANEIRNRRLDVEVVGPCFSSCANYLFPAGAGKTISGRGIVGWHGNIIHLLYLHESGAEVLSEARLAEVRRLAELEREFFASTGVDDFICWFGKIQPYNVRNLYFLGSDDMAKFGIQDAKVPNDYENSDLSKYNSSGVVNLQYIKVHSEKPVRPALTQ